MPSVRRSVLLIHNLCTLQQFGTLIDCTFNYRVINDVLLFSITGTLVPGADPEKRQGGANFIN